jgi:hypothetical protein
MVSYGNFTIRDNTGEVSRTQIITGDVTAVSLPGLLSEWGTLRAAIEGITLGVVAQESLYVFNTKLSNARPTNTNAQVERKWLVTYEDNTQFFDPPVNAIPNEGYKKIFTLEIACADLSPTLLQPNSDEANLSSGPMTAFVNAFEQTARSPHGGRVKVLGIRHVGARR